MNLNVSESKLLFTVSNEISKIMSIPFDIKNQENEFMKAPTGKYAPSLKNMKRAVCTSGLLK